MAKNNNFPIFLYGTAWKENATEALVIMAIKEGFRGIDTANQRVHYFEEAVGHGLKKSMDSGIKRENLFIQTKFTYAESQDHRIPYDRNADFQTQVEQSFQSSLKHLQLDYLDSYLLHGPSSSHGLSHKDWEVWKKMETLHKDGKVKQLGISNVDITQLKELSTKAQVKPKFVQNRCFAVNGWDKEIRQYCKKQDIIYQGFSLLTANSNTLLNRKLRQLIIRTGKTPSQVMFRFAIQVGMIPLTGTTNETHMKEDLTCTNFSLSEEDLNVLENIEL